MDDLKSYKLGGRSYELHAGVNVGVTFRRQFTDILHTLMPMPMPDLITPNLLLTRNLYGDGVN